VHPSSSITTGPLAKKDRQRLSRWYTGAETDPEDNKMFLLATGGKGETFLTPGKEISSLGIMAESLTLTTSTACPFPMAYQ